MRISGSADTGTYLNVIFTATDLDHWFLDVGDIVPIEFNGHQYGRYLSGTLVFRRTVSVGFVENVRILTQKQAP